MAKLEFPVQVRRGEGARVDGRRYVKKRYLVSAAFECFPPDARGHDCILDTGAPLSILPPDLWAKDRGGIRFMDLGTVPEDFRRSFFSVQGLLTPDDRVLECEFGIVRYHLENKAMRSRDYELPALLAPEGFPRGILILGVLDFLDKFRFSTGPGDSARISGIEGWRWR